MNFSPSELFIKLLDFFSILFPGALLAYFLQDSAATARIPPKSIEKMSEAEQLAVLFAASYLLGHLLFLLGSWLDELDDFASKRTLE
ncbi:MAG: hypothetical protein ACK5ZJ_11540 [Acidobacteriota bacterium]